MKKLFAMLLVVATVCSLAFVVSAARPNEEATVLKFTTAPELDGVITEAEWGKPTVHVVLGQATTEYKDARGDEEFEDNRWFDLYIRWDDNNYYVGAYMPDTSHALKGSENALWNGDCIQMGFDPHGVTATPETLQDPWSKDYTNMAFGLVSGEGNTLSSWCWYGPCANEPVEGAKYNIKRDSGYTTYEIAIPWTSLGVESVKAGDVYAATIARVLAEDEDYGYTGWISWGTGILGKGSTEEQYLCGCNALRLSNVSATDPNAPTTTTTPSAPAEQKPVEEKPAEVPAETPAETPAEAPATAPVTADPFTAVAVVMAISAGAALSLKKRK
ncbi:MAG: hypothetical protein IJO74_03510 [Clostridia bacterium]|nr:hypothetical protein [Clostridia bacterium]